MQPEKIRVLSLTSTDTRKHLTWHLRVELLLPYLSAQGIEVEIRRVPKDRRGTRATLDALPTRPLTGLGSPGGKSENRGGYDIAWLHRRVFWPSQLRLLRTKARHLVLDIDDPVGHSSSGIFNFSLSRCLRFRATARSSAAILAASRGLVDLAREHNPKVFYVPLCADPAAYGMRPQPRLAGQPLRLLWLGSRSTFKFLDQVRPHLQAVGQAVGNVELTVVGHDRLSLQHLPVRNISWSPQADREHLAQAHVGLAPMANNRWTHAKAALKPLQYLASGMPFIGSPVGVNLDYVDEGRNGFLADSPRDWVQAVRRLAQDEGLRYHQGENGVRYIQRKHAPEVLARQVGEVFRAVAQSNQPSAISYQLSAGQLSADGSPLTAAR